MATREEYIAAITNFRYQEREYNAEKEKKKKKIEFYNKAIAKMLKEKEEMTVSKTYEDDQENGIYIEKRVVKSGAQGEIIIESIYIKIDLTKHSNPDVYAQRIAEICDFMGKNRTDYILRIKDHKRTDNDYEINCVMCYSYSFSRYHNEHECRWFELKSFFYDLIEMKNMLETTYKEYPAYIEFEKYSMVTKKNDSLPCPQTVLLPVPFIVAYLKNEKTNIDDIIIKATETFIENDIGEEIMQCREIEPIDLEDPTKFQLGSLLNCGKHGAVFQCTYDGEEYAIKQCVESDIPTLRKEAFILTNCDIPFIIKVQGFCETSTNLCASSAVEIRKIM